MERRRTLKMIKNVDASFNQDNDNTLLFETPKPKLYTSKSQTPENDVFYSEMENTTENIFKKKTNIKSDSVNLPKFELKKRYASLSKFMFYFINLSLVAYSVFLNTNTSIKKEFLELRKTVEQLISDKEVAEYKFMHIITDIKKEKPEICDFALPENGGFIDYTKTSPTYKYGFLKLRTSRDPSVILSRDLSLGECFTMKGCTGKVAIMFSVPIYVNEIVVGHPMTNNRNVSVNRFGLVGILKDGEEEFLNEFIYDKNGPVYQKYLLDTKIPLKGIILQVRSNNGNKKYTCLYKIMIFGTAAEEN